jgi:LPXTG-motif cell wall-anchored protein
MLPAARLSAQFTTFVAPPKKAAADSAKPTVAAAKADSVSRMTLTDMKAWVDSAAGTSVQVANASDTTMAAANAASGSAATAAPNANGRTTTTFSNGAIAPNTASPLPTYLAGGLIALGAGLALLRRRRRA